MIHAVNKKLASLLGPVVIFSAAWVLLPWLSVSASPWKDLLPHLPMPAISVGLLLSLQFRRGRVFLALLLLAALQWASTARMSGGDTKFAAELASGLLSLMIPFNITLFLFMRERGVFTISGRMRLGFLVTQAAIAWWLIKTQHDIVARFLKLDLWLAPLTTGTSIPQPAMIILVLSLLVSLVRLLMRLTPVNSALLGAMLAAAAISCRPDMPYLPELAIVAASLALILGVLQDSHDMAFRDELTGLPSRRALNERLSEMGRRYVIAMLDVDHFKGFNDTYGHDVGDQVLKMVASKVQRVKGGGGAYRYGGEEFVIVFPRGRLEEAIPYLEDVRKAVGSYRLVIRDSSRPDEPKIGRKLRGSGEGETVSVTISIGVAESGERSIPIDVLKEADQALYRAKRKGRDILSK